MGLVSYTLNGAMDELCALQAGLSIASPRAEIKKVWPLPPSAKMLNDTPCFINFPRLLPVTFRGNGLLYRDYEVRMQLFCPNLSTEAMAMAYLFEEELIRALCVSVSLNGNVTNVATLEGEAGRLEWGGKAYAGIDYRLVFHMAEPQVMGP